MLCVKVFCLSVHTHSPCGRHRNVRTLCHLPAAGGTAAANGSDTAVLFCANRRGSDGGWRPPFGWNRTNKVCFKHLSGSPCHTAAGSVTGESSGSLYPEESRSEVLCYFKLREQTGNVRDLLGRFALRLD